MTSCAEQLPWCTQSRPTQQVQANNPGQETEVVQLPISEQPEVTDDQQVTPSFGNRYAERRNQA